MEDGGRGETLEIFFRNTDHTYILEHKLDSNVALVARCSRLTKAYWMGYAIGHAVICSVYHKIRAISMSSLVERLACKVASKTSAGRSKAHTSVLSSAYVYVELEQSHLIWKSLSDLM